MSENSNIYTQIMERDVDIYLDTQHAGLLMFRTRAKRVLNKYAHEGFSPRRAFVLIARGRSPRGLLMD